jgi:uncharacterized YccA/Bax inhibitor family protein
MQIIEAEGALFRKAVEEKPRLLTLVGTCVLFLPVLCISSASAIYIILHTPGTAGFIFFWFCVGASYVSFVILYRMFKNYFLNRGKQ